MKVVHIESGLGNQMLSYCEYLAVKKMNPDDDCYLETFIYDIPEANDFICQWNGYELERIFGVTSQNIKDILTKDQISTIVQEIETSEFWKRDWNWPVYFAEAFQKAGVSLRNIRGDFEKNRTELSTSNQDAPPLSYRIKQTGIYANIRRIYRSHKYKNAVDIPSDRSNLFYQGNDDILTGQRLSFKLLNNGIEKIDDDIRKAFVFPEIVDETNLKFQQLIQSCESVAIHARRGDMLSVSGKYYRSGYFRRAVNYIKNTVEEPEFFFFCDPGSIEWCKQNERIFGLNFKKDIVHFVDCNSGEYSFRDMQLMSICKHNIITNSSFGWWGAYLNENENKITISPEIEINTTHHF